MSPEPFSDIVLAIFLAIGFSYLASNALRDHEVFQQDEYRVSDLKWFPIALVALLWWCILLVLTFGIFLVSKIPNPTIWKRNHDSDDTP